MLQLAGLASAASGAHSRACSAEEVGSTPEVVMIEALSLGGCIAEACGLGPCFGRLYQPKLAAAFRLHIESFISRKGLGNPGRDI